MRDARGRDLYVTGKLLYCSAYFVRNVGRRTFLLARLFLMFASFTILILSFALIISPLTLLSWFLSNPGRPRLKLDD